MKMRLETNLPEDLEILIRDVIGVAIEVHRQLGPGFIESIYEQALCYELDLRGIAYERQKAITIRYKTIQLTGQRLDLLVEGKLLLELKPVEEILPIREAQLLSYLKTTKLHAGLIINFNVKQLKFGIRRIVA